MIKNKYLIFTFRVVVGGVFIWAGLMKIAAPLDFSQNIWNYRIVGRDISFLLALVLPWVEVISGAFLIVGVFRRASALLISALLLFFIGLVIVTMIRGINTDCGCFGSLSGGVDLKLVVIDSILYFFALNIFFYSKQ